MSKGFYPDITIAPASAITNVPAGTIVATDVQTALNGLDTSKSATSHVHSAASTTNTPSGNIPSTDVQAALNWLDTNKSATAHIHTAASTTFVNSWTMNSTDVQSAIQELDTNKELRLGVPAVNGYVLSSTTAGVRSWVASGGGISVSDCIAYAIALGG